MGKVIIISGPTASGKTSTSLLLAKEIKENYKQNCAIVNFDSLLFYKELNIGTAKPNEEELSAVEHHLVDICSVKNEQNASTYVELAEKKINTLIDQNKVVILVGGSGFYLRALIKGMYESKSANLELRKEVDALYKDQGIEPFVSFLKNHDPESLANLHENDHYRLMRAYEHFKQTGSKISIEKEKSDKSLPYDFSINNHPNWDIYHLYLDLPKDQHWDIIQTRTKQMILDGLITEVKDLLDNGVTGKEKPLNSIGYKETIDYINGLFSTEEEYSERISISTRQLAKSQRTFFKKVTPKSTYHPLDDKQKILDDIHKFLNK
jgi:tRNA dimethylallyltransferase